MILCVNPARCAAVFPARLSTAPSAGLALDRPFCCKMRNAAPQLKHAGRRHVRRQGVRGQQRTRCSCSTQAARPAAPASGVMGKQAALARFGACQSPRAFKCGSNLDNSHVPTGADCIDHHHVPAPAPFCIERGLIGLCGNLGQWAGRKFRFTIAARMIAQYARFISRLTVKMTERWHLAVSVNGNLP